MAINTRWMRDDGDTYTVVERVGDEKNNGDKRWSTGVGGGLTAAISWWLRGWEVV